MVHLLFAAVMVFSVFVCAASAQTHRTWYTDERIAAAKHNVEQHEWAQKELKRIIETGDPIRYYIGPKYTSAQKFSQLSDEQIWLLQPTTLLPRPYDYSENVATCPVHGEEVKRYHVWCPWNLDPINHPYQIQCMVGGEWYPSNKYHEGDMTSGDFPDDGSGYIHPEKGRFHFLKEYAYMVYGSVVVPTLRSLSQAYLLTGDEQYARKGCILLARVASEYPNYGFPDEWQLENRFERTHCGPWNNRHPFYEGKKGGLISDLIWSTFMLEAEVLAYDALRDRFDDPQVLAFVRAKGMPVETGDDLRRYIEDYLLRSGMMALLEGHIRGNEGHHQAAALAVALVLNDFSERRPNSIDLVDYVYDGRGASRYMMVNGLTRDGGGHESPGYSRIKFDFIRASQFMAEIQQRRPELFPADRYPGLFDHPKARGLFDYYIDVLVLDTWLPPIGDDGSIVAPRRYGATHAKHSFVSAENLFAFQRYGDPRFARAATDYRTGEPHAGDLWQPFPADEIRAALERPESRIERSSRLLDGYGVAILESGQRPHNRAVTLNYSSIIGHRQMDQLSLGLFARDVDLLPDLGYPRTWDYRVQWDGNNLAHNTVSIDERPFHQPRFFGNGARLFADADGVHVINAFHNPYPDVAEHFERTVVKIEVDAEHFYVVDHFQVSGGHQHDQSWHAMLVPAEVPSLDWVEQAGGTLAGEDVAEFAAYTDRWGNHYPKGNFPSYLTQIRRAPLQAPASWTWRSGLPEGDALALHVVPVDGSAEAVMGKGRSPVWAEDGKLDYLLVRRVAENGGVSRFVTVLDPSQGEPMVRQVRVVNDRPLTLEIDRAGAVDRVTLDVPGTPSRTTAHRPIAVRVQAGDRDVRIGSRYSLSTIAAVDYPRQALAVSYSPDAEAVLQPGRTMRIHNDHDTVMFRITTARREGDLLWLTHDHTALVGTFPVLGTEGGRLQLGAGSPYITNSADRAGQPLNGADDFYHGKWVGEGAAARQVAGITRGTPPVLHLLKPVSAAALRRDYEGKVVNVWHFAPGDAVEAPAIVIE